MKIDLKGYKGFVFHKNDTSIEFSKLSLFCTMNDIPYIRNSKIKLEDNYVPSGSVEWCLDILNKNIVPDYYPKWLKHYLYRKVWRQDNWILGYELFVKPAEKYKRFNGFCTTGTYKKKKKPPLIWSEIRKFTNEWRYYISNGKNLGGFWYWGDEINTPDAPDISHIWIPTSFSGTLDFGILKYTNDLALVEAHHPFACGWYGGFNNINIYAQWLINGWDYMKKIKE